MKKEDYLFGKKLSNDINNLKNDIITGLFLIPIPFIYIMLLRPVGKFFIY